MKRTITVLSLFPLAILSMSTPALAQEEEVAAPPATVTVDSPDPDVTVGYVTERMVALGSNGTSAMGIAWKDVCTAPCTFKLPSGSHELVATGPGYVGGSERFDLRPGRNRFVVKPGSAPLRAGGYVLTVLGLTAAVVGVTFALLPPRTTVDSTGKVVETTSFSSWAVPLAIGGGVAVAGGITMIAFSSTSIRREGEESGVAPKAGRFAGVSYAGRF
jgi:hypothetical protein